MFNVQIIQITAIPENKDVTKLQQGHVQIIQITAIPENAILHINRTY